MFGFIGLFRSIFRRLTGKKKITFLGRAGLLFKFNDIDYFIDSEMLTGKYDLVISRKSVRTDKGSLSDFEKEQVINGLKVELDIEGLTYEIE